MPGVVWKDGKGEVKDNGMGEQVYDLDELPLPAYHLVDMDFYTRDGRTVGPLPGRGDGDPERIARLHESYNTRYLDGRE